MLEGRRSILHQRFELGVSADGGHDLGRAIAEVFVADDERAFGQIVVAGASSAWTKP